MKSVLPFLLAATAVVVCAQTAQGQLRQGGYDEATRQLEEGFKIVSTTRVFADDECYPDPEQVANELREGMGVAVVVAPNLDSVQGFGLVNVVSRETECNRLVLAIRAGAKGRVFVLDSDYGPVYVQGGQGLSEASVASGAGPLRDLTAGTSIVSMHRADEKSRFETHCPDATSPLGGGWVNTRPLDSDGAGLYPHSYERLGVQGGFHVTATYIDRSNRSSSPMRRAEIQVLCGRGLVPTAAPHETTFISRGDTGTVRAECPEDTELFSGGFQRTNFLTPGVATNGIRYGGDYVTESKADGNGWRVSGAATDRYGGELTAIAYCADDPSLPITEISSAVHVDEGKPASVATPTCPDDRALIAGGFDFGGSRDALFADGYFTRQGTWAATGYGWFGSAGLTVYGYCADVDDTVDRTSFPKGPPPADDDDEVNRTLLYIGIGVFALVLLGFLRRWQVVRRRRRAHLRARSS